MKLYPNVKYDGDLGKYMVNLVDLSENWHPDCKSVYHPKIHTRFADEFDTLDEALTFGINKIIEDGHTLDDPSSWTLGS